MITLKQLPTSVKLFVERCDAFIVGSAAYPNANIETVNDIDVVIPFHKWDVACIIIQTSFISDCEDYEKWKAGVNLNVYGGLKFVDDGISIDVWPSDLNKYLLSSLVKYVWNPKFNLRYVCCVNTGEQQ